MKRIVALVFVAALAFSTMAATAPQSTFTPKADANPAANCTYTGSGDPSSGFQWERTSSGLGANITAAQFDVTARALEPCWNGDATHASKSFLLVSIQGTANGVFNFPQLGICKFRRVGGEDQTRFCYMDPTANGAATELSCGACWPYPGQTQPIGGHNYRFTIQRMDSGSGSIHDWYWHYNITDVSLGDYVVDFKLPVAGTTSAAWGGIVGSAWWACETGTDANALGTLGSDPRAYMSRAGYEYVGSTVWHYTQNSTVSEPSLWRAGSGGPFADQHFTQDQLGAFGSDRVACYTS